MKSTGKQIDWSYHRNGCKTCAKAQEFLQKNKIEQPLSVVDARKTRMGAKEALKLARSVEKLYVTKGSKVLVVDMKDEPDNGTLEALLIGPTGNLRAPTFQVGKTLLVGFDSEAYKKVLCS